MKTHLSPRSVAITAMVFTLGTLPLAQAAEFEWSATENGNWITPGNWTGGTWAPGTEFPEHYDRVKLGMAGFSPYTAGDPAVTRTITLNNTIRLERLDFEQIGTASAGRPFNYVISGTGKLVFGVNSSSTSAINFNGAFRATGPNVNPLPSEIHTDIEFYGTLNLFGTSQGHTRNYHVMGNIRSADEQPVTLNITGGGNSAAVTLGGTNNDFKGGVVTIPGAMRVNIQADTFKTTSAVRFTDTGNDTKALVLNPSTAPNAGTDGGGNVIRRTNYDIPLTVVEQNSNIVITSTSTSGYDVGWNGRIAIHEGQRLRIMEGNTSNFYLQGAGRDISLEKNAELMIHQTNGNRPIQFIVGDGVLIEGEGMLTTRYGSTSTARMRVADGGIVDPGLGAGNTGILTIGSTEADKPESATPGTYFHLDQGSTLRMQLNGTLAGEEHDQLRLRAGSLLIDETGTGVTLSLSVGAYIAPDAQLTLISVDDTGTTLTGQFAGLADGALVNLGLFKGETATARISYGGLFPGLGNDVVLYDFQMASPIPEPGTYLMLGWGVGVLLLARRMRTRRA